MKTSSAKAKGRRLAKRIQQWMLSRTPWLHEDDIRVTPSGVNDEDLQLSPAARFEYPITPECKNQETAKVWDWMKQAEGHSGADKYPPVVFFSRNNAPTYALLKAEDLLTFLEGYTSKNIIAVGRLKND